MVQLTIDGQQVEVPEGTTVLRAAQLAGIQIPTLCDHPALVPSGGCRLCIVEVEGFRGPTTSCTLPAGPNMVVHTDTAALRASRRFILNMLFSERNHFCPFCEATGGDCELQNAAYGEGMTHWDYQPGWAKFPLDASHADIVIDHNRCILCRRCVRACGELVGNYTLSLAERGAHTMLVADAGAPLGESTCVSCGLCVQVCPTGALIDRNAAYLGKSAQMTHTRSICLGCSVGCGIEAAVRDNQLVSLTGDWDSPVNAGLTCRLGRFAPLHETRTRLETPLVRKDGVLQPATWEEALNAATHLLQSGSVAAVASTRLSAEALALFRRVFATGLGSDMVTTVEEGRPTAAVSALAESLDATFEGELSQLDTADYVLLVGANPADRHGVLNFKIKRRLSAGLRLLIIDPQPGELADLADRVLRPAPGEDAALLRQLERAIYGETTGLPAEVVETAQTLRRAGSVVILYGKGVTAQAAPAAVKALHSLAAALPNATLLSVKGEANSLAAAQYGLDQPFRRNGHAVVYLALGDDYTNERLLGRLAGARTIVQASYASPATECADVVLPVGTWAEQAGHFVNLEGRVQKAARLLTAPEGVRDNQAVLDSLANRLAIDAAVDWKARLFGRPAPVALNLNGN